MRCDSTVQCSTAPSKSASVGPQKRGTFWLSFNFDILNLVLHLRITGELTKDSMTTMQLKRYWLLWYFYVAPAFLSSLWWAKVPSNYEAYYEVCHASTRHWAKELVLLLGSWCWTGERRNCQLLLLCIRHCNWNSFFGPSILAAPLGFIFTGPFKRRIRCGAFTFSVILMKTRAGNFVALVGLATAG